MASTSKDKDQAGDAQQPQPEQPAQRLDVAVPGGRYLVNGKLVNCNGEPLPDQAPDTQQSGG